MVKIITIIFVKNEIMIIFGSMFVKLEEKKRGGRKKKQKFKNLLNILNTIMMVTSRLTSTHCVSDLNKKQ